MKILGRTIRVEYLEDIGYFCLATVIAIKGEKGKKADLPAKYARLLVEKKLARRIE